MSTTKLNELVQTPQGEVTTIQELASTGRIEFREVKNFYTRRGVCTKYFADLDGTLAGWEICKAAYLSATGQVVSLESLSTARRQCDHYFNRSSRCPRNSEDGLPYYTERGEAFCAVHGSLHPYTIKKESS